MKEFVGLTVRRPAGGEGGLAQLGRILPSGLDERIGVFSAQLENGDPKLDAILEVLKQHGVTPRVNRFRSLDRRREYSIERRRHYSDDDLSSCALLEVGFTPDHPATPADSTNARGELILEAHPSNDVSYAISSCFTIVTDEVRRTMEAEGLAYDAIFRPTEKRARPKLPVWRLRSRRTLPPVSPAMTYTEEDGTQFKGDFERRCFRVEGVYLQAELQYRSADLQAMGQFDLAHTRERFGECALDEYRPMVVSARFYQMCQRHGFKGGFTPVRIDH